MKKWTTSKGCMIYQTTKGRANSYLVLCDNISILVDTGQKNSRNTLLGMLNDLLDGDELDFLVITHTHYDHAENAAIIKEKFGAKIIIQSNEKDNLIQGCSPIPDGTNFLTRNLVKVGSKINRLETYPKVQPDIIVDEKYQINPKCFLIHTPGHSKGSMSLIVDDEVAVVGDAMFGVFNWSVFPPFASDIPSLVNSWGKLLETNCKVFLPGHGTENSRKLLQSQYDKYKLKVTQV